MTLFNNCLYQLPDLHSDNCKNKITFDLSERSNMEIKNTNDGHKGLFYIEENGKQLATMTYVFAGENKFIIDHTEVNPGNEGKGLGKLLVKAGVEFAREKGYKIMPLCPYAKSVFDKTEAYKDVLF